MCELDKFLSHVEELKHWPANTRGFGEWVRLCRVVADVAGPAGRGSREEEGTKTALGSLGTANFWYMPTCTCDLYSTLTSGLPFLLHSANALDTRPGYGEGRLFLRRQHSILCIIVFCSIHSLVFNYDSSPCLTRPRNGCRAIELIMASGCDAQ